MTASLGYTSIEVGGAHPETRRRESLEPSHITNISLRTRFPARPPVHPRQGGLMMGRAEPCRAGDPASMPLSTSTVVFLGAGLPRDKQLTCPAKACFARVIAGGFQVFPGAGPAPSAFVKEDLRVFTPPSCATRPIFPDQDAKPHAGATVAVFAASAQFQHALLQFIACDDTRRGWRRWFNRDRSRRWNRTIFRRDHDPRPVGALLIATILVVTKCQCSAKIRPPRNKMRGRFLAEL